MGPACPSCRNPMRISKLEVADVSIALDLCKLCYFVWFDPGELDAIDGLKKAHPEIFRQLQDTEEFREAAKRAFASEPVDPERPQGRLSQALDATEVVGDLLDLIDWLS